MHEQRNHALIAPVAERFIRHRDVTGGVSVGRRLKSSRAARPRQAHRRHPSREPLAFKSGVACAPSELFEAMGFKPVDEAARIETRGAAK
jgi:hypothetical protein